MSILKLTVFSPLSRKQCLFLFLILSLVTCDLVCAWSVYGPPPDPGPDVGHVLDPRKEHYTQIWAVQINGGEDEARTIAHRHGFEFVSQVIPGIYSFKHRRVSKRSAERTSDYGMELLSEPKVTWFQQQIAKKRVKRDYITINDPKWNDMWYLQARQKTSPLMNMNVPSVWKMGYAGAGVVVTILDDGLERDHPDLKGNYDPQASFDVNSNDKDPLPRYIGEKGNSSNRHGTRCAGEVAAIANNSYCGLGIAYLAKIGGIRMLDGPVTDTIEGQSLAHAVDHVDIYSSSWGPEDDGVTVDGPGQLARMAFEQGIRFGRRGLGSIYVWASGNGGIHGDNCNCDGYMSSIYTLGVSAVSETGRIPWYVEECSSTMAVTFSSGTAPEKSVITTDLNNTCTDNHTGTSASAPLAAGIIALVLSANRNLSWRDIQHIVVNTAKLDGFSPSVKINKNGAGRQFSRGSGFGLMDALAMVKMALEWSRVPDQHICEIMAQENKVMLIKSESKVFPLRTNACQSDPNRAVRYLEHVQIKIKLSSSKRGQLELFLVSPAGTVSNILGKRNLDFSTNGFHGWPFMSVHFWGENPFGVWKLTVWSGDSIVTVEEWSLVLYGTESDPIAISRQKKHVDPDPVPFEVPAPTYQEVRFTAKDKKNGQSPIQSSSLTIKLLLISVSYLVYR